MRSSPMSRATWALNSKLFDRLVREGAFIVVEEDVLTTPGLLADMSTCREEVCSGWYWRYDGAIADGESRPQRPMRYQIKDTLACVRFSQRAIDRLGEGLSAAAKSAWHFNQLDLAVMGWLRSVGVTPHLHGPIKHLHGVTPPWVAEMSEADWG